MTTLSTRSRHSNSLVRTDGRCTELSHRCESEIESTRVGVAERRGSSDAGTFNAGSELAFEDEDIASVEAEGTPGMNCPDDGGTVEKQLLTAALVTSIVELAGPSCVVTRETADTCGTGKEQAFQEPRRKSQRVRQALDGEREREGVIDKSNLNSSLHSHENGTPMISLSSSAPVNPILSVKAVNRKAHNQGRTTYQRASKSLASEKVCTVLALTNTPPGTKRKLDAVQDIKSDQSLNPVLRSTTPTPAVPSADRRLRSPFSSAASSDSVPKSLTRTTSEHAELNSSVLNVNMNPSLVPNPLVGITRTVFPHPSELDRTISFSTKTNSLMSAAPDVDPGPKSANSGSIQLEGRPVNSEGKRSSHLPMDSGTLQNCSELLPRERGRSFSLDLDPTVLDFVESSVDLHTGGDKAEFLTHVALGSCDETGGLKNPSVKFKEGAEGCSHLGRVPSRRDREFSFEFFSYGINEDEPLPPIPISMGGTQSQPNRLRGDSIIFDPTSFREGGIHETSALLHIQQESDEDNIKGTSCVPAVSGLFCSQLSSGPRNSSSLSSALSLKSCGRHETSEPLCMHTKFCTKVSSVPSHYHAELQKLCHPPPDIAGSFTHTIPQTFTENTIHMPHGSDAAAAAAAGMPLISLSSTNDGVSMSHTSCPMDLLNEGGRIGIYLPEERKARIAKFHSKRKIRIWRKRIKYDCRKKLADSRPRVKGRFVKRSDIIG